MQINIYKDQMQKAYLFGTAVLYSEKPIPREDVPQHWSSYELRGTVQRSDTPYALEDQASYNFAGSILSPLPLKADSAKSRLVKGKFELTSEDGREWISEDYQKLDSFARDPVVAEAVGQIRQAMEEQTQGQTMTMGGIT